MLFIYPESTRLDRALPKSALYKNVSPSSKQRELLTQQVEKIIWAHKLAPDTLNIKASSDVPEVQVFQLRLKPQAEEVNESVLQYLDKAIPSALIFEVHSATGVQTIACLKQQNTSGTIHCSRYLYGPILNTKAERQALPISRDFLHLHQQLLATLLPYPLLTGESLSAALARSLRLDKLAKTIQQLEAQLLKKSTQFNKRLELNKQLKAAKHARDALLM
ncbi:MAG: DUF4391 domain-containing protein [Oceanisphaera sp.]|uniref:DUF4391 domain-containing protein n=1 Tax=Oceanisphaera sp. TaxID=1929979 RepID=UPI003F9B761B